MYHTLAAAYRQEEGASILMGEIVLRLRVPLALNVLATRIEENIVELRP